MSSTPPAIRILPMNRRDEHSGCKNAEELQEKFFMAELPSRPNGYYRFHRAGLVADAGTLILFQSDGKVIASAVLCGRERFKEPRDGYDGCLYLDVTSIRVFDPVAEDNLRRIWAELKRLGRAKWSLNPGGYAAFQRNLKRIRIPGP